MVKLHYLQIQWLDKETVKNICVGDEIISEKIDSCYYFNLYAYTRNNANSPVQPAFQFVSEDIEQPQVVRENNEKQTLRKIIDPKTLQEWWIENGAWDKNYNAVQSEMFNHACEFKVTIGEITSVLNIRSIAIEKWEGIFNAFQDDLFEIICDMQSMVKAQIKSYIPIGANEEIRKTFHKYIKHLSDILHNPHKKLTDSQSKKLVSKLRPVTKTFIEAVIDPSRNKFTSRDTLESYDTNENRYILYTLAFVYEMVRRLEKSLKLRHSFIENKIQHKMQILAKFEDDIAINEHLYNKELAAYEKEYATQQKEFLDSIADQAKNNLTVIVNSYNKVDNYWICNINKSKYKIRFSKEFNELLEVGKKYNLTRMNQNKVENNVYEFCIAKFEPLDEERTDELSDKIAKAIGKQGKESIIIDVTHSLFEKDYYYQENSSKKFYKFCEKFQLPDNKKTYSFSYFKQERLKLITRYKYDSSKQSNSTHKLNFKKEDNEQCLYYDNEKEEECIILGKDLPLCITKECIREIDNFEVIQISGVTAIIQEKFYNEYTEFLKNGENLKNNDWKKKLEKNDKKEQDKEKESLNKTIGLLKEELAYTKLPEWLSQAKLDLKKVLAKYQEMNIKSSSILPSSMVFVQNINYRGAYQSFIKIKETLGISDNNFEALETLKKMGVMQIPKVYERWCLLQVIKVITEVFGFKPLDNWKDTLISQIVTQKKEKNIDIRFIHENGWEITLWYEKELESKKRPDIMLELITKTKKQKKQTDQTDFVYDFVYEPENKFTMVLDAKYKEEAKEIEKDLKNLSIGKNYAENGKNWLFIIHPCPSAIYQEDIVNPQTWGKHSYYGEGKIFDYNDEIPYWEDEIPSKEVKKDNKHRNFYQKYGFILLNPESSSKEYGAYLDNLQRLIGMFLNYPFYSKYEKDEIESHNSYFCLACGSNSYNQKKSRETGYEITCEECGHFAKLTHCYNCREEIPSKKHKYTTLFKHGTYWTYHKPKLFEPYNINCPKCGSCFD